METTRRVLSLPIIIINQHVDIDAIPCIGKDLGMSTVAYASLMVELQQDAYTSKTRESQIFEGNNLAI